MTDPETIKRFVDHLARLTTRHGIEIAWTPGGMQLTQSRGGYVAWPDDSGGYGLDAVAAGYTPETEGEILSDDWSPEAREERARQWREENAEAIAQHNARHDEWLDRLGDTFGATFRRTRGTVDPDINLDDQVDPRALPVGAFEHVCRQHGVELRVAPEGVVLVPAREGWQGYDWREAEHPVGAVVLVERGGDSFGETFREARGKVERDVPLNRDEENNMSTREELEAEIARLRDQCERQSKVLRHLFPDRSGTFFISGEGGGHDENGLPETLHICPAYGADWIHVYQRTDRTAGPEW